MKVEPEVFILDWISNCCLSIGLGWVGNAQHGRMLYAQVSDGFARSKNLSKITMRAHGK